jgi:hypothetical protein
MRGSVEPLPRVGIGEPEVGAAVDDRGLRAELFGQCGGMPVRQGEENHVVALQDGKLGGLNHSLCQWNQVRVVLTKHAAGTRCGGRRTDGEPAVGVRGMPE